MLTFIDNLLNRITMYRLMLYFLLFLLSLAFIFSLFGLMPFSWLELLLSATVLTMACLLVNKFFARIFKVPTNAESAYITAWILTLIVTHTSSAAGLAFLALIAVIAMGSKYLVAWQGKHIFNPAAIAVTITYFAANQGASWWVGNIWMQIPIIIGGILIVRKIRRWNMVYAFFGSLIIGTVIGATQQQADIWEVLKAMVVYSPIFFFAFVMFTEPSTSPPKNSSQIIFGIIVGILASPFIHFGNFYIMPEMALVIGNLYAFAVSTKTRFRLTLQSKTNIATGIFDFVFQSNHKLAFAPGQYLEWTLPVKKTDTRGNRRYFTIASSPTESEVHLGSKFYENPSAFKQALMSLDSGDQILAGQLAGDFVLPANKAKKLIFIAGGIGITPFRSMLKYLIDKNEKRDIVLFICCKNEDEVAFKDVLSEAKSKLGIKIVNRFTDKSGLLDSETIRREAHKLCDSIFYVSGPRGMVMAFENLLKSIGIPRRQIKVDFFPGYI